MFICAAYNANRALYEIDANENKIFVDEKFYYNIVETTANNYNLGYFGPTNFVANPTETEQNETEQSDKNAKRNMEVYEQINYAVIHGIPEGAFNGERKTLPNGLYENATTYFFVNIPISEKDFNYYNPLVIGTYYRVIDINYIILFAGIIMVFIFMCQIILGLITRIFNIAMLYVIAPPILAMMPLDGGGAFGSWKKSMIGHVLGAYGAVVGMNLALMFMSVSSHLNFSITLFGKVGYNSVLVTQFMRLLFILVALNFAKKMPNILSGFIGATDAYGEGKAITADVANTAKKGAAIAAGVGGLAFRGAKGMLGVNSKVINAEGNIIREDGTTQKLLGNTKIGKYAKSPITLAKKTGSGIKKAGSWLGHTGIGRFVTDATGLVTGALGDTTGGKALKEIFNKDGIAKKGFLKTANVDGALIKKHANKIANERIEQLDSSLLGMNDEMQTLKDDSALQRKLEVRDSSKQELETLKSNRSNALKQNNKEEVVRLDEEIKKVENRINSINSDEKVQTYNTLEKNIGKAESEKNSLQNAINAILKAGGDLGKVKLDMPEMSKLVEAIKKEVKNEKDMNKAGDKLTAQLNKDDFSNLTADDHLIEQKQIIKEAIRESNGDMDKLAEILKRKQLSQTIKMDSTQLSKFMAKMQSQVEATEKLVNTEKQKTMSKEDKANAEMIKVLKNIEKQLDNKGGKGGK